MAEDGKRELDRLFEETEKANRKNTLLEGIQGTVDRLPLPDLTQAKADFQADVQFRFPAYGFLLLSMLLGISFTGSLAELAGGHPLLGKYGTLAVLAGAGPGFVGTFIVAVKTYNREKEEDDRRLAEEEEREENARQQSLQGPVMMPQQQLEKKEE